MSRICILFYLIFWLIFYCFSRFWSVFLARYVSVVYFFRWAFCIRAAHINYIIFFNLVNYLKIFKALEIIGWATLFHRALVSLGCIHRAMVTFIVVFFYFYHKIRPYRFNAVFLDCIFIFLLSNNLSKCVGIIFI